MTVPRTAYQVTQLHNTRWRSMLGSGTRGLKDSVMSLDATLFDPFPYTLNCLNNTLVTIRRSFRQYINLIENWMEITNVYYGAPFVTCTLLLTEANFVQQNSFFSNKSNFVYDKSNFVYDKITFVRQKLILSDKSWFCQTKVVLS